jgi:Na+:H+ antiporter, NhaA family
MSSFFTNLAENCKAIMRITKQFTNFFESEKSAGLILIVCTILSLGVSNTALGYEYIAIWHIKIGTMSLEHWINDGLMAIFFLMVGLELEREVYNGELSNFKEALLPFSAALGGMIVPACIYFFINKGLASQTGVGIPMATDIAFALGILSLLGRRVPLALKVFLTALAVIDDLGAIIVIALFYTKSLAWPYLIGVAGIMLGLFILNRKKVNVLWPYLIGGVILWYCMLKSGVHASISGVLLAFVIPFGSGSNDSISNKLEKALHLPVALFIIPVFALANTAFTIDNFSFAQVTSPLNLGIILGLVIGKPIGIVLFTWFIVRSRWSRLPANICWWHILGAGFLGGIGFTMSIFISFLAFDNVTLINQAKLAILIASFAAALIGYFSLSKIIK